MKIELYCTADGWVARFVDAPEIFQLFGTLDLPTAYTQKADADTVLREIRTRNPGIEVTLLTQNRSASYEQEKHLR